MANIFREPHKIKSLDRPYGDELFGMYLFNFVGETLFTGKDVALPDAPKTASRHWWAKRV